jgi:hypothetical protein
MTADMSRSVSVDHELVGLRPPGRRIRPVAGGPFALAGLATVLLPIRQPVIWAALVLTCNVMPWILGVLRRRRAGGVWRLSEAGLEQRADDGTVLVAYERRRIEEFTLTSDDGVLMVFHRFGRTPVGTLTQLGFDPLDFMVTAHRLGIPAHVVDGDQSLFDDDDMPGEDEAPRVLGRQAEERLRSQEAALLAAVHEERPEPSQSEVVQLGTVTTGRVRIIVAAVLGVLLGLTMLLQVVLDPEHGTAARFVGAGWVFVGALTLLVARRRRLATTPLTWTVTPESVQVSYLGERRVDAAQAAAFVVAPGVTVNPVTGDLEGGSLSVLVFDHRLGLLARLPARGLDAFQLAHALHEQGYRVITPETGGTRPSDYGLDGLPEIFSRVPGGRLVVDDDGVGWADGAGDVILRMPRDRIGAMELLTVDGHAWLRMYDDDGEEFLAAPLSTLRISRTDLRESARRVQLPVTDAEYDAYVNAAFHRSMTAVLPGPVELPEEPPADEHAVLLDVPGRARVLAYAVTATLCEFVGVLGALWLRNELGGFWTALAWAAPAGLVLGLAGAWLYDRNRSQLRVDATGVASVTRLGRVEWTIAREAVGGVGIDESQSRTPRLVVWSPAGRVLRRVSFPPDLRALRRACEQRGLPWGPPDADQGATPPPEI